MDPPPPSFSPGPLVRSAGCVKEDAHDISPRPRWGAEERPPAGAVKPAIRSALAAADVEEAVELYFAESAPLALRFVSALERAVRQIEAHPESGSPRYAHELNLPQLRFRPCLLYTSPSPRHRTRSRIPSSA